MAVLKEQVADELAVRELVARFSDAVNRRAPLEMAALWATDGVWVVPGVPETTGRDAIAGVLTNLLETFPSLVQMPHTGVVSVDGDSATARWFLSEFGCDASGGGVYFIGTYHDQYRRDEDGLVLRPPAVRLPLPRPRRGPGQVLCLPRRAARGRAMAGLTIERPADGVALVTLDRPERLNALDDELLTTLVPGTFADLARDDSVHAVVVTGAGRGFCAGADLDSNGFGQPTALEAARFVRSTHQGPVNVRRLPQPTIAAVNGPAIGAGFGLALACDLRFAAPGARFGAPFVGMGLVPDYGVSYFLPRVVGTAVALDILLTGRIVGADEALALGLVSRVVDDVVAAAVETATAIAANPPQATQTTRANVYRALELSLEAEILEQEVRTQAVALHGSEFPERFAAWKQKIQGR